jgi:hypothetical protein
VSTEFINNDINKNKNKNRARPNMPKELEEEGGA